MRYSIEEKTVLAGQFDGGVSVSIVIVNIDTDTPLSLVTNVCLESDHIPGLFLFDTTNISTVLTQYTSCAYYMTDGSKNFYGKFSLGGYIDENVKVDNNAIADAVWNKLLIDMVTAGTAGERLKVLLSVNKYLALQK
jgi:hypothetical protein